MQSTGSTPFCQPGLNAQALSLCDPANNQHAQGLVSPQNKLGYPWLLAAVQVRREQVQLLQHAVHMLNSHAAANLQGSQQSLVLSPPS